VQKGSKSLKNSRKLIDTVKRFFHTNIYKRSPCAEINPETGEPEFFGVHTYTFKVLDMTGYQHLIHPSVCRVVWEAPKYQRRIFKNPRDFFDFYSELKPCNRS